MQLTAALLADAAVATPEGKLYIHGGGIDTLFVARVPAVHAALAVAVTVLFEASDAGQPVDLSIALVGPTDTQLMVTRAQSSGVEFRREHPYATVVSAHTWSPLLLPDLGTYRFVVDAGAAGRVELPFTVALLTSLTAETATPPGE